MKLPDFVLRRVVELRENPDNTKTHPRKQIEKIKSSIRSFGFVGAIVIDDASVVLCGNGRLAALRELGIAEVPTVCVGHLTEAQRRALAIADNKTAEDAPFDDEQLARELQKILDLGSDFEITDTGFEIGEIDFLLGDKVPAASEPPFDPERVEAVSRAGDLWLLGKHRLFCGTALEPQSYEVLLGGERAQLVVTDPPFNIAIPGVVSGLGKVKHGNFVEASGEMTPAEFSTFLRTFLTCVKEVSEDGGLVYSFIDWRQVDRLMAVGRDLFGDPTALCVWNKGSGGLGGLYRSQHELCVVFKNGNEAYRNNVKLGVHGRNRTNVWDYPGLGSFGRGRGELLAMHPTVKNLDMIADAILDCSDIGGLVLDPFGGSGTTLIAAERTRRRAAIIELDPRYCDVILRRFCDATGIEPVNAWTGEIVGRRAVVGSSHDD